MRECLKPTCVRNNGGFNILELLVILGIICVLGMFLLSPSLSSKLLAC